MPSPRSEEIKQKVRETYGKIAVNGTSCCDCSCAPSSGYEQDDLVKIPDGADLGLGCGNPQAIAGLHPGETVLDLGSGAGVDCFLAADAVGDDGRVIGIDMTAEMLSRARANASEGGYSNVGFRLGEIENLPVADASIDIIMSNCVINLSPDKEAVYREAFRVLKPGGRLAISDIVTSAEIPDAARNDLDEYAACVSGAASIAEIETILADSGFEDIHIEPKNAGRDIPETWEPGNNFGDYTVSAAIQAVKPGP